MTLSNERTQGVLRPLALCLLYVAAASLASAESPYPLEWVRQFGSANEDGGIGVNVVNDNNVMVAANQVVGFSGRIVFHRFDATGNRTTTNFLSSTNTLSGGSLFAYAFDSDPADNMYVTGYTDAPLRVGDPFFSGIRAYVAKTNSQGALTWARYVSGISITVGFGVAAGPSGTAHFFGQDTGATFGDFETGNAFVANYGPTGNIAWVRNFRTPYSDYVSDVATDSAGNVYIVGSSNTADPLVQNSVFEKYRPSGQLLWSRPGQSAPRQMKVDSSGNIYGLIGDGIGKLDSLGNLVWQFPLTTVAGSSSLFGIGAGTDFEIDFQGNLFFTGTTPFSSTQPADGVIGKFSPDGQLLWTQSLGTNASDVVRDLSIDSAGNLYVVGTTFGSLGGPQSGNGDVFVAKFTAIPEPAAIVVVLTAILIGGIWSRRRLSSCV